MERLWILITIAGPVLLLAAIIYAWWRNKNGSRAQIHTAERGAAQVREDMRKDPEYTED